MPDVLSQSQIDELLLNLNSGKYKADEVVVDKKVKNVKKYDFTTPKRISKDQLRSLSSVFDNFARGVSSYLSGILRTYCNVEVESVEEQRYSEYYNSLSDSVLLGIVDFPPIEGSLIVNLSKQNTFMFIDLLLGGTGDTKVYERDYTEIEIGIIEKIYRQISFQLKDAWSGMFDGDPVLAKIEANSKLVQLYSHNQNVLIVILNTLINDIKSSLSICIPVINLEKLISSKPEYIYEISKQDEIKSNAMMSSINDTPLQLSAILGNTILTLGEISDLQCGDVIRLNQNINDNIKVVIDNKTKFYGKIGIRKGKKVVLVNKVIQGGYLNGK